MSADPDHLTRPEKAAAFGHARAFMKRELADGKACTYCVHRTTGTFLGFHRCRTNPDRTFPGCTTSPRGPCFELDEAQVQGVIHG